MFLAFPSPLSLWYFIWLSFIYLFINFIFIVFILLLLSTEFSCFSVTGARVLFVVSVGAHGWVPGSVAVWASSIVGARVVPTGFGLLPSTQSPLVTNVVNLQLVIILLYLIIQEFTDTCHNLCSGRWDREGDTWKQRGQKVGKQGTSSGISNLVERWKNRGKITQHFHNILQLKKCNEVGANKKGLGIGIKGSRRWVCWIPLSPHCVHTFAGCQWGTIWSIKANLHGAICRPDLSAMINREANRFMYSASTAVHFL